MPENKNNELPIVLYTTPDGGVKVNAVLKDESLWLSQTAMVGIFEVDKSTISRHIKNVFAEGELDEKVVVAKIATTTRHGAMSDKTQEHAVNFYNLDMIIAVGYRVNSRRATQFRIWATKVLREYIVKGFALDDERMKTGRNMLYFDELQERIRQIRLSERVFYQKVKDIYATSIDYDPKDKRTIEFFKIVQNKLLWAISKETAAELVVHRANAALPFMGMQSYDKTDQRRITQQDAITAKNYLNESEIKDLGLLVEQYLAFAEAQAQRHVAMTMNDWIARLDAILKLNGRELLQDAGKISHQLAEETAMLQLTEFRDRLRREERLASIEELEHDLSSLPSPTTR